jgi:ubiquinone/menaquinone biosynthesis C-methylase UbiE
MSFWGKIFAAGYDRFMAGTEKAGLSAHRQALLAKAAGRVLEIGAGTGANLPFYRDGVIELILSEPAEPMARRLARRLEGYAIPARVLRAPAEDIPVPERSIDVVVSTLALCSVADPTRALAEVRRVLRPPGLLLFIEHVRSADPKVAAWQDRLRRPWAWFGRGCQTNRRTLELMRDARFTIRDLRETELPKAPSIVRPLVVGSAVPRS